MNEEDQDSGIERRKFFRLDFTAPIRYRFAKAVGHGKYQVSPYFKGRGVNFFGGGAALNLGKPLPPETLVLLEMLFPFSEKPVMATAEVIRKDVSHLKGREVSVIMVKFLLMEEAVNAKLVSFLISRGRVV